MNARRPPAAPGRPQPLYVLHVVPGLEELATEDLAVRFPRAKLLRTVQRFDERTSLLMVRHGGAAEDLLELPMVEDVFTLAADARGIAGGYRGLRGIRAAMQTISAVGPAIAVAAQVRPKNRRKSTFRVVARKAGSHAYRRADVQHAVQEALLERYPDLVLVDDDAQLEVWATLIEDELIAGVRLSDNEMRHRDYLATNLPASLKPTIAYAMVTLTAPDPEDTFLDPMCGAGTLVIERALTSRYKQLLAGDIDPVAVQATRDNVGPRYKPLQVDAWDARALPLAAGSVTALASNLPFGKQIGSEEANRELYPALLTEWLRVLRPGGHMVLLTGDRRHLLAALKPHAELRLDRQIPLLVRGLPATIYALQHVPGEQVEHDGLA
ncbi:MAG: methyltransferase domain-containing protein [Dehalococcoidia bacterium]